MGDTWACSPGSRARDMAATVAAAAPPAAPPVAQNTFLVAPRRATGEDADASDRSDTHRRAAGDDVSDTPDDAHRLFSGRRDSFSRNLGLRAPAPPCWPHCQTLLAPIGPDPAPATAVVAAASATAAAVAAAVAVPSGKIPDAQWPDLSAAVCTFCAIPFCWPAVGRAVRRSG